MVFNNNYY